MDISIERVTDAYGSTQTEPMAGGYYRKEGQRTECCVLSVLYLHQFGVAALESLVEQTAHDWSFDPVPYLAQDLLIHLDLARGLVDGFDGNDPFVSYPETSITDLGQYQQWFRSWTTRQTPVHH